MKKEDLIKTSQFFGSPKRTAILFILSTYGSSNYLKIIGKLKQDYNWKSSASETFGNLHKLEKLNAVEWDKHNWFLTPIGRHMVQSIESMMGANTWI